MLQDHLFGLLLVFIPTIPSLVALLVGIANKRSMAQLHSGVNGRLTQLLTKVEEAAYQHGKAAGYAEGCLQQPQSATRCENYKPTAEGLIMLSQNKN